MQGQTTFQIVGDYNIKEKEEKFEITDEDIKLVIESTNVSEKEAKEALENTKGDIAKAIIKIQEKNN
jgi:nascent polypeptide-associated complex subunit alpha